MRCYFSFLILCFLVLTANAQVDNKNKSTTIPAVKSKNDSASAKVLLPSEPIKNNTVNGVSVPKTSTTLNMPKKEFSMFGEKFGNPGELYEDKLNKKTNEIKEEMLLGAKGSTTDQYFGDFKTKSQFVNIAYRDFGLEDGDLIQVLVNDEIIKLRVLLTNGFKGFKLDLKEGFNKIEFLALNEGYSLPNTAEFHIIDDNKNTIASNQWNLSKGVKAVIIVVKE